MKKYYFIFLLFALFSSNVSAQFTNYIVKFKDKTGTPFSINNPSQFLSSRSIERRTRQHIAIDETDLPIVPRYLDSVRLSGNVIIHNQSKWLNQVCIQTSDSTALAKINNFPFVVNTQPVKRISHQQLITKTKFTEEINKITSPLSPADPTDLYSYGNSYTQIHIHEGEYLHNKGFHGEGMLMAIIDAGFYHYQTLPAFDSIRMNNQIMETYDFVGNKISVNEEYEHGMECLSIIAGNIPGQLVGSCPKAKFYLYRSEDISSESPIEEENWIAAAERADSIGIDVTSTSLGYNTFDNPQFNYTYADMDGHTSMIAKGASLAAQKGMIVIVAAGNEGNNSWHYILTPADADSVLTVGAVDASGNPAGFSSYGPSSDGRVKPVIASMGVATAISSTTGPIVTGNGTSFATPNMAGLVTCLWQAFPEFTNMEIIEAVKKSSSIYNSPDDRIGYGIPNFRIAYEDLSQQRALRNINAALGNKRIKIYPNPFRDQFTVLIKPENTATGIFNLYDANGKLYFSKEIPLQADQAQAVLFNNIQPLQRGMYILKFSDGKNKQSFKVMVQ
ncbi:MAG: S8 family serine peptidase [Bacteroidota bacterium]|nr:S8 family serine peptidase [Bacteroidota bacterium]